MKNVLSALNELLPSFLFRSIFLGMALLFAINAYGQEFRSRGIEIYSPIINGDLNQDKIWFPPCICCCLPCPCDEKDPWPFPTTDIFSVTKTGFTSADGKAIYRLVVNENSKALRAHPEVFEGAGIVHNLAMDYGWERIEREVAKLKRYSKKVALEDIRSSIAKINQEIIDLLGYEGRDKEVAGKTSKKIQAEIYSIREQYSKDARYGEQLLNRMVRDQDLKQHTDQTVESLFAEMGKVRFSSRSRFAVNQNTKNFAAKSGITQIALYSQDYWHDKFTNGGSKVTVMSKGFWGDLGDIGKADAAGAVVGGATGSVAGGVGAGPGAVAGGTTASFTTSVVKAIDEIISWF